MDRILPIGKSKHSLVGNGSVCGRRRASPVVVLTAMAKQKRMPTDLNQRAKAIVGFATSEEPEPAPDEGKDPNAVALGRKGGAKGGKARAEKMTHEERSEAALRAVNARWSRDA